MRNSKVPDVAAMKLILITLVALVMGTIVACAGGAVEVNTVPTATTTPGVNPANRPVVITTNRPIAIPTNRPIAIPTGPSSNSTRPGVAGQIDPCNCHGYAGFGGPCYDGFGGPAYAGFGGPAYAGLGGPCYSGFGGPRYDGFGGPAYAGFGGPCYDEAAVVNYGQEFFRTRKVSQDTFDAALAQFGVLGLTELTNLMGCYSMLAFNVNAFGVELPEDSPEKPLPV
jgi:hypothetical protein